MATAAQERIAVIVPIVAPVGDGGLIGVDELTSQTGTGGDWAVLAATARDHRLTIALDSRILASINSLGITAPGSVTKWRDDVLSASPLILPWGNADPFVMTASDADGVVTATMFADFAGVKAGDLVAWPTTSFSLANSVARSRGAGFASLITDRAEFPGASSGIDSAASAALAAAVSPAATDAVADAAHRVSEKLTDGAVLALPRDPSLMSAARVAAVLDALFNSGMQSTGYSPVITSSLAESATISDPRQAIRDLVTAFESSSLGLTFAAEPAKFIIPRAKMFAAISNLSTSSDFEGAVAGFAGDTGWAGKSVYLSLNSSYTVLSNSADIPVNISNDSDSAVTVVVSVRATSAIVQVSLPRQVVTIDARSNVRISVPMTAVANGRTDLIASVSTEDGVAIGAPVVLPIEVQAQWELVTVIAFVAGVGTIMTIGVIRTIRRRRKTA